MIRFREMVPDDVAAVAALEAVASPDPWSAELFRQEFEGLDNRTWLVAERPTAATATILGFGGTLRVTDELHIMNLAVDPSFRRQGLASRLLAGLLLDGLDRGSVSATLEVRASNRAALGLYQAFGFTESGRRTRYYQNGEDAVIMWRHRLHRPEAQADLLARLGGDRRPGEALA